MEYSGEPLELFVAALGRTSGTRFIVERGVEAALFEAVQPVVDSLAVPSLSFFNIGWRESFQILASSGETLDCLRICLVRELLADSTFRGVGNLGLFLDHIGDYFASASKLPVYGIQILNTRNRNSVRGRARVLCSVPTRRDSRRGGRPEQRRRSPTRSRPIPVQLRDFPRPRGTCTPS